MGIRRRSKTTALKFNFNTEQLQYRLTIEIFTEYTSKSMCLHQYVRKHHKSIDDKRKWTIISETLCGLEYLHSEARIIHRDIKPGNIIYSSDRQTVKIIDFGLARDIDEIEKSNNHMSSGRGSLLYQAPETVSLRENERVRYTSKIDVWGVGCVLSYLLTGKALFNINPNLSLQINTNRITRKLKAMNFDNPPQGRPALSEFDNLQIHDSENRDPNIKPM